MKKIFLHLFTFILLFTVLAPVVFAQAGGGSGQSSPSIPGGGEGQSSPGITINLQNPFKVGDTLYEVLQKILSEIIMPLGGVLCVLTFIYAGFSYVTAQGNETKLKTANRMLLYAAIGTAVLLGAQAISYAIEMTVKSLKP